LFFFLGYSSLYVTHSCIVLSRYIMLFTYGFSLVMHMIVFFSDLVDVT